MKGKGSNFLRVHISHGVMSLEICTRKALEEPVLQATIYPSYLSLTVTGNRKSCGKPNGNWKDNKLGEHNQSREEAQQTETGIYFYPTEMLFSYFLYPYV